MSKRLLGEKKLDESQFLEVQKSSPQTYIFTGSGLNSLRTNEVSCVVSSSKELPLHISGIRGKDGFTLQLPYESDCWIFSFKMNNGREIAVSTRKLNIEGSVNFRDLGGYYTTTKRQLKWRKLFRSGHLSNFTEKDRKDFERLGISTICDFRTLKERSKEDTPKLEGVTIYPVPIIAGIEGDDRYLHKLFANTDKPEVILDAMLNILEELVKNARQNYRKLFEIIMSSDDGGVLLNCSAGKERTGIGAALLLLSLGVKRTSIEYDFMLSRKYFPIEVEVQRVIEKYELDKNKVASKHLVLPLLETRPSYIQVLFKYIDSHYGSVRKFFQTEMLMTEEEIIKLKKRFII